MQVDLELACGAATGARLERALRNAEFEPETARVWRWRTDTEDAVVVVKFELLADRDDVAAGAVLKFDGCEALGAVNLRGTGFAARDVVVRELTARVGDDIRHVEINTTGLAGFLLAKIRAARERRLLKDWYDVAFVLLHNDAGGPEAAALRVREVFGTDLVGATLTALNDLIANFEAPDSQGPQAYARQMIVDRPDLDSEILAADAVVAVVTFGRLVLGD